MDKIVGAWTLRSHIGKRGTYPTNVFIKHSAHLGKHMDVPHGFHLNIFQYFCVHTLPCQNIIFTILEISDWIWLVIMSMVNGWLLWFVIQL